MEPSRRRTIVILAVSAPILTALVMGVLIIRRVGSPGTELEFAL